MIVRGAVLESFEASIHKIHVADKAELRSASSQAGSA